MRKPPPGAITTDVPVAVSAEGRYTVMLGLTMLRTALRGGLPMVYPASV